MHVDPDKSRFVVGDPWVLSAGELAGVLALLVSLVLWLT
jgi:hypothetical protein